MEFGSGDDLNAEVCAILISSKAAVFTVQRNHVQALSKSTVVWIVNGGA
jgi:hypothetical protein